MFWALLLGFSLYSEPVVCGVGLVIMLTGVPVYFLGVHWKEKPKCIYSFIGEFLGRLLKCFCKIHQIKDFVPFNNPHRDNVPLQNNIHLLAMLLTAGRNINEILYFLILHLVYLEREDLLSF